MFRRRTMRLVGLVLILAVLLLIVTPSLAQDDEPVQTSESIIYVAPCMGFTDGPGICFYTQSGGVQRSILTDELLDVEWNDASWRPNGEQLVLGGNLKDGTPQLFFVDADGSNRIDIPLKCGGIGPAWSPDGDWIAFHSCSNLAVMQADGTGEEVIANGQDTNRCFNGPQWSPDSQTLVATVILQACAEEYSYPITVEIATFNLDDRVYKALATNIIEEPLVGEDDEICGLYENALFSPDGSQLVYQDAECQLNLINLDGSEETTTLAVFPPSWSKTAYPQWNGQATILIDIDPSPIFEAIEGIPGPEDISMEPEALFLSSILAIIGLTLFGFASTLFGNILSDYEDDINEDLRKLPKGLSRLGDMPNFRNPLVGAMLFIGLTAILESFLEQSKPPFSLIYLQVFFTALVAGVLITLFEFIPDWLMTSQVEEDGEVDFKTQWFGIVIVIISVLITLTLGFQPGFLFGFMGALTIDTKDKQLSKSADGRRALAVFLVVFLGSHVIWFASPGFSADLEALAKMVWFAGLQGTLFGLLPILKNGDGRKLFDWSLPSGLVFMFVASYAFVHFLLYPGFDQTIALYQQNSLIAIVVMGAIFALFIFSFLLRYPVRLDRQLRENLFEGFAQVYDDDKVAEEPALFDAINEVRKKTGFEPVNKKQFYNVLGKQELRNRVVKVEGEIIKWRMLDDK